MVESKWVSSMDKKKRMVFTAVLWLCLSLMPWGYCQQQTASPSTKRDLKEAALAALVTEGEVVWLPVSSDEEAFSLYQKTDNVSPAGIIILIPDENDAIESYSVIKPIQERMLFLGWHVLTVSPLPPFKSKTSVGKEQEQDWENYEKRMLGRVTAAMIWVQAQNPRKILLISHGTGGGWAGLYLSTIRVKSLQGLVTISAYPPVPEEKGSAFQEAITKLKDTPVMDVIASRDYDFVKNAFIERHKMAVKIENNKYDNRIIYGEDPAYSSGMDTMIKLIQGWLKKNNRKIKEKN